MLFFRGTPVVAAAIFVATCALTLWFFSHFIQVKENRIESALKIQAEKIESNISYRLEHTHAIMHNMGQKIAKNHRNKRHIRNVLTTYKENQKLRDSLSWTVFSWANSHHDITVSEEKGILRKSQRTSIAQRSYISDIVENPEELIIGEPTLGAISKKWLLPVGAGVTDKKERYLGALIIGFEIDSLSKSINEELDNENISFELISSDGKVILYGYEHSFGFSQGLWAEKAIIDSMRDQLKYCNKTNIVDIALFQNRHAILGRKIEGFPHYLILRYDDNAIQNELLGSFTSRASKLAIFAFLAFIFILLIYKREKRQERIISHFTHKSEDKDS